MKVLLATLALFISVDSYAQEKEDLLWDHGATRNYFTDLSDVCDPRDYPMGSHVFCYLWPTSVPQMLLGWMGSAVTFPIAGIQDSIMGRKSIKAYDGEIIGFTKNGVRYHADGDPMKEQKSRQSGR